MATKAFQVGDRVLKHTGDYQLEGIIVARFWKRSGEVRYVVEDDRGLLLIYGTHNLRPVVPDLHIEHQLAEMAVGGEWGARLDHVVESPKNQDVRVI